MVSGFKAKFVGVDWAKGGWLSIAYDAAWRWEVKHFPRFRDLAEHYGTAALILVDIPIGLAKGEDERRKCDLEARARLGRCGASVFWTPPRQVVEKAREIAPENFQKSFQLINKNRPEGKGMALQTWNIVPMILQVDDVVAPSGNIKEIHPEICFWALNKKRPMVFGKKKGEGIKERLELLNKFEPRTQEILEFSSQKHRTKVARDDILDALAAAVTARLGYPDQLATLPDDPPTDARGIPMEMVFYNPRHA